MYVLLYIYYIIYESNRFFLYMSVYYNVFCFSFFFFFLWEATLVFLFLFFHFFCILQEYIFEKPCVLIHICFCYFFFFFWGDNFQRSMFFLNFSFFYTYEILYSKIHVSFKFLIIFFYNNYMLFIVCRITKIFLRILKVHFFKYLISFWISKESFCETFYLF